MSELTTNVLRQTRAVTEVLSLNKRMILTLLVASVLAFMSGGGFLGSLVIHQNRELAFTLQVLGIVMLSASILAFSYLVFLRMELYRCESVLNEIDGLFRKEHANDA